MHPLRATVLTAALVLACAGGPAVAADRSAGARGWQRPVDGDVLRLFSVGPDRYAAGQHRGVDLAAPPGAPVRAACAGRVSFAGRVPRGGRTVSVRCGALVATHQHLGAFAVRRGQVVAAGAAIGRAGGARPRPHVHLGARVAATGRYLDPLALLSAPPRAAPPPLPAVRPPRPLAPRPVETRPATRRPVRVRPAPAPVPAARPLPVPRGRPAAPHAPPRGDAGRLPWPVWLGLALVALGLPLGGAARVRTRRRRAHAPAAQVAT